jgi:hypothetical protein
LQGHRYYDPATGTWLTRDPIGQNGGINVYGYVGGDPVNWGDEGGLKKKKRGGIGGWWDDRVQNIDGYWKLVTSRGVKAVRKVSEVWFSEMVSVNKWVDGIDTAIKRFDSCHTYFKLFHDAYAVEDQKAKYNAKGIDSMEVVPYYEHNWIWFRKKDNHHTKRALKLTKDLADDSFESMGNP